MSYYLASINSRSMGSCAKTDPKPKTESKTNRKIEQVHKKHKEQSEAEKAAPVSKRNVVKEITLTTKYYAIGLNDTTAGSTRKAMFKGKLICPAHNRGQKKDVEAYSSTTVWGNEKTISHVAKALKIKKGEETKLDPYGKGNCFGGSLVFCKKWLNLPTEEKQSLGTITEMAKEFEEGIPVEGVVAQGVYARLLMANSDNRGKMTYQTSHLVQLGATAYNSVTLKEYSVEDRGPQEVLDFVAKCNPGAYQLVIPTYGPMGGQGDRHDVAFIKVNDKLSVVYDPNYGVGFDDEGQPEALMKRVVETYTGPLDTGKTVSEKTALAWKKMGNFFTGAANPPLFSEINSGFEVYRLAT